MDFSIKLPQKKAKMRSGKIDLPHLEVVFLHIPKCAGTSMVLTLYDEYGKKNCARLDIKVAQKAVFIDDRPAKLTDLPERTKVLHGHFRWDHLNELVHIPKNIKVFTWIRDPLDRMISNYNYLRGVLKGFVPEHRYGLILRMARSFEEFIEIPRNQNILNRFIENTDPFIFDFIGDTKNYNQDFAYLCKLYGWQNKKAIRANKSKYQMPDLSPELIERVKKLNHKDFLVYKIFSKARKRIIDTPK